MCFFEQHMYACGDWKWGHFRQHCNREYRTGETCGMKLVYAVHQLSDKCKICQRIDVKQRRRAAEVERVCRWKPEGRKFAASIEKSEMMIKELDEEIRQLTMDKYRKAQAIGSGH
ncbi:hypothetical protein H2203_000161 [Taxawa tesnikishii (nom. ined.)]|nr:hypothetical protein H2203_000161 [Dothideales sp. JES 119]